MSQLPVKLSDYQVFECSRVEPYSFDVEFLRDLYRKLLLPRIFEEKMLLLLRHNKIAKWFSGIGQEAVKVGAVAALEKNDFVVTIHRCLGAFLTRGVPMDRLFSQFQGKDSGYTKGRERSYYCYCEEEKVVGGISHLASHLPVADGLALAQKLYGKQDITLVITGEGGTSEGDFHEALNLAAIWKLPVIFLIQNNGYALSTPTSEQFAGRNFSDYGLAHKIKSVSIDGNNVLEVYKTVRDLAKHVRKTSEPVVIEAKTFRMRGHEEASGNKYVPESTLQLWQQKDPILQFERSLLVRGIIKSEFITGSRDEIRNEVEAKVEAIIAEPDPISTAEAEIEAVYAPFSVEASPNESEREIRFVDAIHEALDFSMQKHENLILMGQDIAEYGGAFKATDGFVARFGKDRVRNTPTCESAIIGATVGLSLCKYKSVVEMQFGDFVSCGFNQLVNHVAKLNYRWGTPTDTVIRMPCGGGTGGGPYHSQTNEAWFMHTPGLKIAYPATPADAKGLLMSAILDPNPVVFFEHKLLYRSVSGAVPEGEFYLPFGQAEFLSTGEHFTIISYGLATVWALSFVEQNPQLSITVLDLKTLAPLDWESVREAVQMTSRVLVLYEANLTAAAGSEIAAWIAEHCYQDLDAPVMRCASLDTPIPFAKSLEQIYLANVRLADKVEELLNY